MHDNEEKDTPQPLKIDTPLDKTAQIDLAEKLQSLLLMTYERRLESGTISDTGLAALQRLLAANGWTLDPSRIPTGLKEKLTTQVDAAELDEDVLPFRKQA